MYTNGTRIQAIIGYTGEIIEANVIGVGTHKGRRIYDLDNCRFVYESQVLGSF